VAEAATSVTTAAIRRAQALPIRWGSLIGREQTPQGIRAKIQVPKPLED
jgi:hypothetical protein